MRLFPSIFKKKSDSQIVQQERSFEQKINRELRQTNDRIKKGKERATAGTGTPMEDLHGAAKFNALLANIGEGSKATGGGGMASGFDTVVKNAQARTAKTMIDRSKQKKLK